MRTCPPEDLAARAKRIELVALDVDGVLTDGQLDYTADGELLKRFHVRDGMGIRLLLDAGIDVAIITGRECEALRRRARDLQIPHFFPGTRDKLAALRQLAGELELDGSQICFVGDDVPDMPAMRAVGLAVAVADAHPSARKIAHWVTTTPGGRGAVREVVDHILEARMGLETSHDRYIASQREPLAESAEDDSPFGVIIPARYNSSRLPGKPLIDLGGKPMIVHVMDNARRSGASFVWVATEDERIARVVEDAGGDAIFTSPDHTSGTDRLAEAVKAKALPNDAVVVNMQGDEPLLDSTLARKVARALHERPTAGIATVATPIREVDALFDPGVVKVVVNHSSMAVTFSRAPVPWVRERFNGSRPDTLPNFPRFLRHVGLYGYRVDTLLAVTAHPPVPLEQAEALEQLRALWLGVPIHVSVVDGLPAHGVDTKADLARVLSLLERRKDQRTTDRPAAN